MRQTLNPILPNLVAHLTYFTNTSKLLLCCQMWLVPHTYHLPVSWGVFLRYYIGWVPRLIDIFSCPNSSWMLEMIQHLKYIWNILNNMQTGCNLASWVVWVWVVLSAYELWVGNLCRHWFKEHQSSRDYNKKEQLSTWKGTRVLVPGHQNSGALTIFWVFSWLFFSFMLAVFW